MRHSFLDKYSELHSIVHHLDPRTKIVTTVFLILTIVLTNPMEFSKFFFYFLILICLTFLAKIKVFYIIKRASIVLPFVFLVIAFIPFLKFGNVLRSYNVWLFQLNITDKGLLVIWNVFIKSFLSSMSLVLLSSTTPFSRLLKGFEKLGLPIIFVMILSFMYRYIFVLVDEALKMNTAMYARNAKLDHIRRLKVLGNIIGSLFLRTYERAERIYMVMLSRGFNGHIRLIDDLRLSKSDLIFATSLIGSVMMIKFW